MLIPTKHENLNRNLLVLGADILIHLKKSSVNVEELYQKIKLKKGDVSLDEFFNALLFLWLNDLIFYDDKSIEVKIN
ncbi:MAG: hypothetical protein PHF26_03990 [Candidatus Gracilibacteria bacterium]|nr:hypothetical protein [Candidatus Gracilibacteria bacterium]